LRSGDVWILRKRTKRASRTYQIQTKNIYIMLLYNSRCLMHVPEPKNQFFNALAVNFAFRWNLDFWENRLSGLVEYVKYKHKTFILCYYTIHSALCMCPKVKFSRDWLQNLRSNNVWILRKRISRLVELIKYKKNIYIMSLYN